MTQHEAWCGIVDADLGFCEAVILYVQDRDRARGPFAPDRPALTEGLMKGSLFLYGDGGETDRHPVRVYDL